MKTLTTIVLITVLLSTQSKAQTYEFESHSFYDQMTGHKSLHENYTVFTFSKDSILIEMQTYDNHTMHFNYAILFSKKEGKHVYFESENGFQFYLDKKVEQLMVVHEKTKLVSVYY